MWTRFQLRRQITASVIATCQTDKGRHHLGALTIVSQDLFLTCRALSLYPLSPPLLATAIRPPPDEWVLVHAGAGGVGLCAIQLAKAMGARVIATAGTPEKLDVCKRLGGADFAINYRDKDWQAQVKKITEGHGIDVVYDPVGLVLPSLKVIAWNGRIVVVGFAAGTIEKVPMNLVLLKNCAITGVHVRVSFPSFPKKVKSPTDLSVLRSAPLCATPVGRLLAERTGQDPRNVGSAVAHVRDEADPTHRIRADLRRTGERAGRLERSGRSENVGEGDREGETGPVAPAEEGWEEGWCETVRIENAQLWRGLVAA